MAQPEWWLVLLGLGIGFFGTLIGAGGGFLLVPILLLAFPDLPPQQVTAISLCVVALNALSGTVAYARRRRVDYRSGIAFALATVPGAILGALTTTVVPRRIFDIVFGTLLLGAFAYLARNPEGKPRFHETHPTGHTVREITDASGETYRYAFDMRVGLALSVVVGYLSSLLGIGGGIVHVPALVHLLDFPVHVATATSHFVLAITALAGVLTHIANGTLSEVGVSVALLAPGVILGAQAGAVASERVKGANIVRALAIALGLVGLRVLIAGLEMHG